MCMNVCLQYLLGHAAAAKLKEMLQKLDTQHGDIFHCCFVMVYSDLH
jgi:hypothetical protein